MVVGHNDRISYIKLFTRTRDDFEAFAAFVGDVLPILGGHFVLREEFRTHTYAEDAGLEPSTQILFVGGDAAGYHDLRPGHGCHESLDHIGPVNIAGEELGEVATQLLGLAYLANATAAGAVGHEAAVAHRGNLGVEERAYDEAGSELQIHSGRRSIHDGANAEGELRALFCRKLYAFGKDLLSEIAAVGKLEGANAALVTGLDDLLSHLSIFVVEHGHHGCLLDFGQYGHLIESSHGVIGQLDN